VGREAVAGHFNFGDNADFKFSRIGNQIADFVLREKVGAVRNAVALVAVPW
jgi:hypothetical protein